MMRQLSKITFINSAHIRFGTVELDGNVHFTGTQGVGKSTLLRAILFFYNADKLHLGIRLQGQKPFDDFYLPNPNSYIVYEVSRDTERPFSVIVFKLRNRAVFRFVDAPFDNNWLIDDGIVTSDQLLVRQRILKQGLAMSNIVDRYEQYRDIIYGNVHQTRRDMHKYCIMQSTQYKNLPRIIQNVFLNERVDANFIKDTIIHSMSGDEETSMDLRFFRSKLADFDAEYSDIRQWSRKNRSGELETLKRANLLIDISHAIRAKNEKLYELCGNLNYAMSDAERNIPILQNDISNLYKEVKALFDKLNSISEDYEKQNNLLVRKIGVLDKDISSSRRKKKEYKQLGIEDMLRLDSQEPSFKAQKQQVENEITAFERNYQSIAEKYKILIERLQMDERQFIQEQDQILNRQTADFNAQRAKLMTELSEAKEAIDEEFKVLFDSINSKVDETRESIHHIDLSISETRQDKPFGKEIEECKAEIARLENDASDIKTENDKRDNQMEALRRECEIEELKQNDTYGAQEYAIEAEIKDLDRQIAQEEELIKHAKGSLCEWLDENVDGWKDNIGKVVDEKSVLYHTALSPRLNDKDTASMFGISIDLEEIDKEVRTPKEISISRDLLLQKRKERGKALAGLRTKKENEVRNIEQRYNSKIKSLRIEKSLDEQRLAILPQQIKKAKLQIDDWMEKQKAEVDSKIRSLEQEKSNLLLVIGTCNKRKEKVEDDKQKRIKQLMQKHRAAEREARQALDAITNEAEVKKQEHSKDIKEKLVTLEKQRDDNMKSEGADIAVLNDLKRKSESIGKTLKKIAINHETIVRYRYDDKELFSKEQEFVQEKHSLETELKTLKDKYNDKKTKATAIKAKKEKTLADKKLKLDGVRQGLDEAKGYVQCDTCPSFIHEVYEIRTKEGCAVIVDRIKQIVTEIYQAESKLKEATNDFKRYFSERNTFKFPASFDTTKDYMAYAESVDDFVANDKIKDFEKWTSKAYIDILSRVWRDFSDLMAHESDIMKVVKDINYDFTQKTFAGVIRGIELRLERSNQTLIAQLQSIYEFWAEHQFDIGEANLFSGDNRDTNKQAIDCLKRLTVELNRVADKDRLLLSDTFTLKFKIEENDNSTGWIDNIKMVGSDGTDILVKAIINILLINVFKKRVTKRSGNDFRIHCMMDEIGKLADENIQGILDFANRRNIYIVNSSPKAHRPLSYRHLYVLSKDKDANTIIQPILSTKQSALQ